MKRSSLLLSLPVLVIFAGNASGLEKLYFSEYDYAALEGSNGLTESQISSKNHYVQHQTKKGVIKKVELINSEGVLAERLSVYPNVRKSDIFESYLDKAKHSRSFYSYEYNKRLNRYSNENIEETRYVNGDRDVLLIKNQYGEKGYLERKDYYDADGNLLTYCLISQQNYYIHTYFAPGTDRKLYRICIDSLTFNVVGTHSFIYDSSGDFVKIVATGMTSGEYYEYSSDPFPDN